MGEVRGQGRLRFPNGWGGNRKSGWARKQRRKGRRVPVAHRRREPVSVRNPVHVTMRIAEGLGSLKCPETFAAVRGALNAGKDRLGCRLNHFSIQSNHLHLIVEAEDRRSLTLGLHHGEGNVEAVPDGYSSGEWFDGWRDWRRGSGAREDGPVVPARSYLLATGWRRHGLLGTRETPGGRRPCAGT